MSRRLLLIKTSSLGDVIHTLPALTDAARACPGLQIDWIVEEGFAAVPAWHPAVQRVLPVALRRWRRSLWQSWRSEEFRGFRRTVREGRYDHVIDAQGLLKSAWITRLNPAPATGLDWSSAREPLASLFYRRKVFVPRDLHAVERTRRLFAATLDYPVPDSPPDYGIQMTPAPCLVQPHVFLLHGTTWSTKHYPESAWARIVALLAERGLRSVVTWGNDEERARAERFAALGAHVLPRTTLPELAAALKGAQGVISVDTGLGHLATALDVPVVGLYAPTNPDLSGIYGPHQVSLQAVYPCSPCLKRRCQFDTGESTSAASAFEAPCWGSLGPQRVVEALLERMAPSAL